jgi:transposase-like protein
VKSVIETSRPIAQVAKELGVNEGTLGNRVSAYKRDHAGEEPPSTVNERARLRELERETAGTSDGTRLPEKSRSVLCQGSSMSDKFEFIDAEYVDNKAANNKNARQLSRCVDGLAWAGRVSMSGGPGHCRRPRCAETNSGWSIAKSFDNFDCTYGYRRVHADLAAWGVGCGLEFVANSCETWASCRVSRGRGGTA